MSEEAGCFYHPDKKACVACDQCGRFLCSLCDLPLEDQHLCPHCLEVGKDKKILKVLDTRRTLYGDMILSLSILPLLMWPLTFLTAPAALFLAFLHRHKPSGMVGVNQKLKMGLGILIALMEILGWGFGLFMVVSGT